MAYSLYKMNKGLDFFEELMRASFQYSSNKIKHPSIRDNSFYSINSCSFLNFQRSQRFDFVFLRRERLRVGEHRSGISAKFMCDMTLLSLLLRVCGTINKISVICAICVRKKFL